MKNIVFGEVISENSLDDDNGKIITFFDVVDEVTSEDLYYTEPCIDDLVEEDIELNEYLDENETEFVNETPI